MVFAWSVFTKSVSSAGDPSESDTPITHRGLPSLEAFPESHPCEPAHTSRPSQKVTPLSHIVAPEALDPFIRINPIAHGGLGSFFFVPPLCLCALAAGVESWGSLPWACLCAFAFRKQFRLSSWEPSVGGPLFWHLALAKLRFWPLACVSLRPRAICS